MELTKKELAVLRQLGQEYMEIAVLPVQKQKMEQWKAFNRHDSTRPMVVIEQLPWNELNTDGSLTCVVADPVFRQIEWELRSTIYKWNHFPVDMVVEPFIKIPKAVSNRGYGIRVEEETRSTEADGQVLSHAYDNQIKDYEDIEKIKDMVITHDTASSALWLEQAGQAFSGIAPVVQGGGITFHLGVWDSLSTYMGVENIYYDLVDRPEFVHAVIDRITNSALAGIRQANELKVHDDIVNTCHCSYIYTDEQLPGFGEGKGSVSQNCWSFAMAQLFSSVSPDITDEFEIAYISRLAKEFGMLYYGCCERLDDRLEIVQKLPNVKKISCSPWSNREQFAEQLNPRIILSNKPSPAFLAEDRMNTDEIKADLKRTCEAAKRNHLSAELILKDISTVRYDPKRLTEWAEIAMRTVEAY